MSVALRRLALIIPAVAVLGLSATAHAQVTIHLTTTQNTTCDVTTDASGVNLEPGGTDLFATGVTLSGTGCGGGSGPPTPNNFPLTVSANPVTGTPFSVSWSVTGATSCTGSATLGGTAVSLTGWTDVTTPTSPRSVTASTAGTYTLSLTCSNTSGSVTSQPAQVVVAQGAGGNCPQLANGRTQATISDIHYLPEPPTHVRHGVDITQWDNIWGHIDENDDVTPWPGVPGASPTISTIGTNQYLGARFHVGAESSTLSGNYVDVSYGPGPPIDAAISTQCGDFTSVVGCVLTAPVQSQDQPFLHWRMTTGSSFWCQLQPNTDYYFNVQFHDLAPTGPGCVGSACEITIQHFHN